LILVLVLIVPGNLSAQGIADNIYPTDDELFEAYLLGDIDYQTYLNLVEIFEIGVDSSNQYLLDEIPYYNYFNQVFPDTTESEKKEEAEPFIRLPRVRKTEGISGSLGGRYFQELKEDGRQKSQYQWRLYFPNKWSFEGRCDGDYDGNYLFRRRTLTYKNNRGFIKKFVVGNFTARYGLGLTTGYRGKLLSKDAAETGRSVIFPDYGGFNGIYVQAGRYEDAIRGLIHYDQNDTMRIEAAAVDFLRRYRQFQGEFIVLGAALKNRINKSSYNQYQIGACLQYRGETIRSGGEICWQNKGRAAIPALLTETEYRDGSLDLRLAGWRYDREFVNLFGGGRSGYYYDKIEIEEIDFEYRDRRAGEQGIFFTGDSKIGNNYSVATSLLLYGRNRYERTGRLSFSLEGVINSTSLLRLHYLRQERDELSGNESYHIIRTEYRRQGAKYFIRSYLGYNIDRREDDFISYFIRLKGLSPGLGRIELWMNVDRINVNTKRVDYLYMFIRETVRTLNNFELAAKYSFRYNRTASDRHESRFLLEGKWEW
jgi:hypothetical protein